EEVAAQRDPLARDLVLVAAAAVVVARDAGVGRGALGPVDPAVLDFERLGRMVASRQPGDKGSYSPVPEIDGHDPRGIVAVTGCPADALVRVAGKERAPVEPVLEGETDRRAIGLKAVATRLGLADLACHSMSLLVENHEAGRERVVGIEHATGDRRVVIAPTGKAGA